MTFVSLSYFFPLLPLLRSPFPVLHSHLSQIVSSHLNLGLPFGLVPYGFHLYMVLATLSLGILSTCPNQLNLLHLTCLTIFSYPFAFSSSSSVLSLHSPSAFFAGPNIFLPEYFTVCLSPSAYTDIMNTYLSILLHVLPILFTVNHERNNVKFSV